LHLVLFAVCGASSNKTHGSSAAIWQKMV
jgi:hypothetical protein